MPVSNKKPDVTPEQLWGLWLTDDVFPEAAIGYLIQIALDQQRFILKNGRHGIMLLRAEAEFRQTLNRLEKEIAQLRREVERLKNGQ